ncbi:MAG: transglycosylase SLT domain-containing protein, partial [Pseudomonadales bacterium]
KRSRSYSAKNKYNREIILYGIERLARSDPEAALKALNSYRAKHVFDPEQLKQAHIQVGIFLALLAEPPSVASLPVNLQDYPELTEALIRGSLRQGDWAQALTLINLLPESHQESPRWRYWTARLLANTADRADIAKDITKARDILKELATLRNFYGFVAADLLGIAYNYNDEPHPVSAAEAEAMAQNPGVQRALELFALGERTSARREWYFSTGDFTQIEAQAAAKLALDKGWHKAAIQVLIDAEAWNSLDSRFPIAFREWFTAYADQADIPVQWALAVARQESAFVPDARSPAGALGVMQLIPSTARIVSRRINASYQNSKNLLEPELNIRLGSNYLGQLLRRFDNNRILASAAYNAGATRVVKWQNPALPFEVWIEAIPFTETRNYVQSVLMFASIYSRRMAEPLQLLTDDEQAAFAEWQAPGLRDN